MEDMLNKFSQFLNLHWFRPEVAFLRIYDYAILRELFPLPEPSIDLCCGDGTSSYIWAGGKFDIAFDVYQSVCNTKVMFEQNIDVFDSCADTVNPIIVKSPEWNFTCGLDLKTSLLEKAEKLHFYDRLVKHDLNDPMPFREEFNSAFSTTIWLGGTIKSRTEEAYAFIIKEVNKILKQGGSFVFRVHESKFKKFMFDHFHHFEEQYGFKWAKRLDRFMYQNNPPDHLDIHWWIACLEKNGFEVKNVYNYFPRLITFFYLIGFRPMFNSFIQMYNMLTPSDRIVLKKQWLQELIEVFEEFVFEENVKLVDPAGENTLYMIEATKNHNV